MYISCLRLMPIGLACVQTTVSYLNVYEMETSEAARLGSRLGDIDPAAATCKYNEGMIIFHNYICFYSNNGVSFKVQMSVISWISRHSNIVTPVVVHGQICSTLVYQVPVSINLHLGGEWQKWIIILPKDVGDGLWFEPSTLGFRVEGINHYTMTPPYYWCSNGYSKVPLG